MCIQMQETQAGSVVARRFRADCLRAIVEGIRLVQIFTAVMDTFAAWKSAVHVS